MPSYPHDCAQLWWTEREGAQKVTLLSCDMHQGLTISGQERQLQQERERVIECHDGRMGKGGEGLANT